MQATTAPVAPRAGARGRRAAPTASSALALVLLVPPVTLAQAPAGPPPAEPARQEPAAAPRAPRLAVGSDITITLGPRDPHFFNYTDYEQNALRQLVANFGASFRLAEWLDAVGELRVENHDRALVSALYARVRPTRTRGVAVLAGRVPPVFGVFARTRYGNANPLISQPLAYQYLSTVRPDAQPRSVDALLAVRGRGWRVSYPAATPPASPRPGVPLVSTSRWDTGVVGHLGTARFDLSAGLTVGSLSDPRVDENNDGRQLAVRAEWRPDAAWQLGLSAARGAFVSRRAIEGTGRGEADRPQAAVGVDVGFARDRLALRGELLRSTWDVRVVDPPLLDAPLAARAAIVEARYRLHPRLDLAARADGIDFAPVSGTRLAAMPVSWDADVARVELGGVVRLGRRTRLKLVYQHNWRFGTTRTSRGFPAAQLAVWF